jgi:hypothetical protein
MNAAFRPQAVRGRGALCRLAEYWRGCRRTMDHRADDDGLMLGRDLSRSAYCVGSWCPRWTGGMGTQALRHRTFSGGEATVGGSRWLA